MTNRKETYIRSQNIIRKNKTVFITIFSIFFNKEIFLIFKESAIKSILFNEIFMPKYFT